MDRLKLAGLRYLRDVEEREALRLRAEAERLSRAAKRRLRRRRQPRLPIAPKPLPPGIVLQVRAGLQKGFAWEEGTELEAQILSTPSWV